MSETTSPAISIARIATAHGSRYLTQLCKHWGHKFPVSYDAHRGAIELPAGGCTLEADAATLAVRVEAAATEGLARLEQVVEEHIRRFAFREELSFAWTREAR
ncbi:MAG: DUF2218 domain-containing protein [Xanthobacteraceae bacterium]|nr:DUF2218 domain-containing protein [Xanthobacteraceae bacterium]